MGIRFNCYPGGKHKALTMSYDDGRVYDRRLVEIFDRYGIKASFHLNSGFFGRPGYIHADEVSELYRNHEVSCHTVDHPFLENVPATAAVTGILDDRRALEALAGYPVRGMSYPFGTHNDKVIGLARAAGMEYARTIKATGEFRLPDDFLAWHPTCHHSGDLDGLLERFGKARFPNMQVFYLWGHSYEFNDNGNWSLIEDFCARVAGMEDTWFATSIGIVDYVNALRGLRCTLDMKTVCNPSATDVWIEADGVQVPVRAGETKKL